MLLISSYKMRKIQPTRHEREEEKIIQSYCEAKGKVEVSVAWTKYLLTTHPIEFITTVGRINGKLMTDICPIATCLDTSYEPPYVTFSLALKQHSLHGQKPSKDKMNTYLNLRQNGLFIVNVPGRELLGILNIIAQPYKRKELEDKIAKAGLTKATPFTLNKNYNIYPPLIQECLAHLECRVVDIHRPKGGDHYNITGEVISASYDSPLGKNPDEVRLNLTKRVFHHFGASSENPSLRYIAYLSPDSCETITFHLERKPNGVK